MKVTKSTQTNAHGGQRMAWLRLIDPGASANVIGAWEEWTGGMYVLAPLQLNHHGAKLLVVETLFLFIGCGYIECIGST